MAKTILEALNELVEKQGGNTEDNKLIVDALNDIVESSGGSSGGSGFTVTFTVNTVLYQAQYGAEFSATCDKTANEVMSAISSGEKINLKITSLEYDDSQVTSYYSVLSSYAYPQDGQYGIATLTDNNKVIGFGFADGSVGCSVYQYAEVPSSYYVYTTGGIAKVGNETFTGNQLVSAFGNNITFQINGGDYRPLSCTYSNPQHKATIDFSIGGVLKRYTLDDSGNFAEVV